MPSQNPFADFSGSMTLETTYFDPSRIPPPDTLMINMTMLDEVCERARGFRQVVLNVDGEMHRYKTADVLRILKQVELKDGDDGVVGLTEEGKLVTCGLCGATVLLKYVDDGLRRHEDPPDGWGWWHISGIVDNMLCPSCNESMQGAVLECIEMARSKGCSQGTR